MPAREVANVPRGLPELIFECPGKMIAAGKPELSSNIGNAPCFLRIGQSNPYPLKPPDLDIVLDAVFRFEQPE